LSNSLIKLRPQVDLAELAKGSADSIKNAKASLSELDTILMEYIKNNKDKGISPALVLEVAKYFAYKVITETKNLYDLSSKQPRSPLDGKSGQMLPEDIVREIEALPAGAKAEVLANIPETLKKEV
jgi:hypothetical protein